MIMLDNFYTYCSAETKSFVTGELDPRGGMEAAKVLNDELPEAETVSNKLQTEQQLDTDFMRAHPLKIGKFWAVTALPMPQNAPERPLYQSTRSSDCRRFS